MIVVNCLVLCFNLQIYDIYPIYWIVFFRKMSFTLYFCTYDVLVHEKPHIRFH